MTFPVLIPPTVAVAGLNRIFLQAEVPGYFSAAGTYCLPLTLAAEAVDTGIPRGRGDLLGEIIDLDLRCAHGNPVFTFSSNRAEYLKRVRPPWIGDTVNEVEATIRAYEQSTSERDAPLRRQVLWPLRAEWEGVKRLIQAALYVGEGVERRGTYSVFAHDASFFGYPPVDLHGLLKFLKAFREAHAVLVTGMTDRVRVKIRAGGGELIRALEDPLAGQADPAFDFIDVKDGRLVKVERVMKNDVRPLVVLEADEKGAVDLENYRTEALHPAYTDFQDSVFAESQIFLGLFLCAHYGLEAGEIDVLTSPMTGLFFDDPETALAHKLRTIGRRLEDDAHGFQAAFVSRALTRALTTVCGEA